MANSNAQAVVEEQAVENNVANAEVINVENNEVSSIVEEYENANPFIKLSYKDKIKKCIERGDTRKNGLRIKNVKLEPQDNYVRITFIVDKAIPGMVLDPNNEDKYILGTTNNIFTSTYGISGMLKEDADLAWIADIISRIGEFDDDKEDEHVQVKPEFLNLLFCGAEIDVLQSHVEAGEVFINPFTSNTEAEGTSKDHEWFTNNVISVKLSKTGRKALDRLADKVMGF